MIDTIIYTPSKKIFEGKIKEMYIPTPNGEIGIFPNYEPFIYSISLGELSFIDEKGEKHILAVTEGFLRVFFNKMYLSIVSGIYPHDIDIDKIEREQKEIEEYLKKEQSKHETSRMKSRLSVIKLHIATHNKHKQNYKERNSRLV